MKKVVFILLSWVSFLPVLNAITWVSWLYAEFWENKSVHSIVAEQFLCLSSSPQTVSIVSNNVRKYSCRGKNLKQQLIWYLS